MRESVGGAMMFYIILTFFSIFVIFLAGITQYGRVFKTKNYIVNYLEQSEGIITHEHMKNFDTALKRYGYHRPYKLCRANITRGGVRDGNYYYVTLYAQFEVPLLPEINDLNKISIPIKGDTRLVETGSQLTEQLSSDVFNIPESGGETTSNAGEIFCFINKDGKPLQ